jgi:hypothetical protein
MTTPFPQEKAPGLNFDLARSSSRLESRNRALWKKKRPHLRRVIAKLSVSVRLSRLLGESDDSDD